MKYFFVYGTLRRDFKKSAISELHIKAFSAMDSSMEYLGVGIVYGCLYDIKGNYPGFVANNKLDDESVVVEVYKILKNDWSESLDAYEDIVVYGDNEYIKTFQECYFNGQKINGLIYEYIKPTVNYNKIDGGDYANYKKIIVSY